MAEAHTTAVPRDGNPLVVTYHATDVVIIRADGGRQLNSGGYSTRTTLRRINKYADLEIYQKGGAWYVPWGDSVYPFTDNMVLYPDRVVDAEGAEVAPVENPPQRSNAKRQVA